MTAFDSLKPCFPVALHDVLQRLLLGTGVRGYVDVRPFAKSLDNPCLGVEGLSATVSVGDETLFIPYRVNFADAGVAARNEYDDTEWALINALYSRHANGYVREKALDYLLPVNQLWVVPYILGLAGQQVKDVVDKIYQHRFSLDKQIYMTFIEQNPQFWSLTKQRVTSYWNTYYRETPKGAYSGFLLVDYLEKTDSL